MAITATIGGAVIGGGASLLAGSEQAGAAKKAAALQATATNNATNAQMSMYNNTRSDLAPFVGGGANAFSQLSSFLGPSGPMSTLLGLSPQGSAGALSALRSTPGYQFAFDQGLQGIDRSAASRGLLLSGGQLKDATNYGQGMADQLYGTTLSQLGNYAGLLGGVANTGESAAATTGQAGTATGSGIAQSLLTGANGQANSITNAGTAQASGIAGAANNFGSLLNNSALLYQLQHPGGGGDVFGSAQGAADIGSLALSDRRLKTDIRRVGKTDSGLALYSYRMKGSPQTQIGVMADEVRRVAPDAVRRLSSGFDAVDYRRVSQLPPMRKAA